MFTGLVEAIGNIEEVSPSLSGKSSVLKIKMQNEAFADLERGESIAVNGCCLTVTEFGEAWAQFDVSQETLSVTNLGKLVAGSQVNLERALPMGKRLGGHLVSGHIDGIAKLKSFEKSPDGSRLVIEIERELSRYTIKKGSATIDGISLTINAVHDEDDHSDLEFMIIPETLAKTTLGAVASEWSFNIEVDMLAKFAERIHSRH